MGVSLPIHTRGKGHSAVNGAAYRARCEIVDERTGERRNYSNHNPGSVLFEGIYAPKDAPAWAQDRGQLWNHLEAFEKRSDAQLCRTFTIALPHELTLEQNRRLLQDWTRDNFTRKGIVADVVIHAPDKHGDNRNLHAHVAVPLRKLDGPEFAAKKERTASRAERNGELEAQRESWEKLANRHLERAGLDVRIDRRSHKDRGIQQEPTIHLGPAASMERRGQPTELGDINRAIKEQNARAPQRLRDLETREILTQAAIGAARVVAPAVGKTAKGIAREADREIGGVIGRTGKLLAGVLKAAEHVLEMFDGGDPVLSRADAKRHEQSSKEKRVAAVGEQIAAQKKADLDDLLRQSARGAAERRLRTERGEEHSHDHEREIKRER